MVEQLCNQAQATADIQRQMMKAKSLRQSDNPEGRTDLYMSPSPEQTLEGRAATAIEALAQSAQVRVALVKAVLEAAAKACDAVESPFNHHLHTPEDGAFYTATEACETAIRNLDPAAIAAIGTETP